MKHSQASVWRGYTRGSCGESILRHGRYYRPLRLFPTVLFHSCPNHDYPARHHLNDAEDDAEHKRCCFEQRRTRTKVK